MFFGYVLISSLLMCNNERNTFHCLSLLTLFYFKPQILIVHYVFTINTLLLEINYGLFELVISKNSYGVGCLMR